MSDIHGRYENLSRLIASFERVEAVLLAGDITNFGDEDDARLVLRELSAGETPPRLLSVAGNCDPKRVRDFLESEGISAEGRVIDLGFARVAGAGGGLFRNGSTSFERSEDDLYSALIPPLESSRALAGENESPLIVLTHTPPYGTQADLRYGRHVGSKSFAAILAEFDIKVWVCGHIHESACAEWEGGHWICNPGPASLGKGILIDVEGDRVSAELVELG